MVKAKKLFLPCCAKLLSMLHRLLLGAIDGNTSLDEEFIEVALTDKEGTQHNGDLQDEFLRQVEEK